MNRKTIGMESSEEVKRIIEVISKENFWLFGVGWAINLAWKPGIDHLGGAIWASQVHISGLTVMWDAIFLQSGGKWHPSHQPDDTTAIFK